MNLLKSILLLFFLLNSVFLYGQFESEESELHPVEVENSMLDFQLGFVSARMKYELKLTKKIVLVSSGGMGMFPLFEFDGTVGDEGVTDVLYTPVPFVSLESRYYYNMKRRSQKELNTRNNAANYFSLNIIRIFEETERNSLYAPTWGFQRNFIDSKFNYEFHLGIAPGLSSDVGGNAGNGLIVLTGVRFGYVL